MVWFAWKRIRSRSLLLTLIMLLFCFPAPMHAAGGGDEPLVWTAMGMGVVGGLALFLFGMDTLTQALKAAAGTHLQTVLARFTSNRFSGALVGAIVTAVIQSSSVTTVLVVGFVSAGLMTLSQSIGVIMGANIGTTITAQIIAFKITHFSLLFVAIGFPLLFWGRQEQTRHYGGMIFGLGLVFFGMSIMNETMLPLRNYAPFIELMVKMQNPLLGILVGALFTALIQSSSATTGIVIVLASQGFISLSAGIALSLGANVGTCVTAMLASIGKPRVALRAAASHVLFNLAGVVVWIGLIDVLAGISIAISPAYGHLTGVSRVAAEAPRQIANANTLFNIANTLFFIPFTPWLSRLVTRIFPDRLPRSGQPIIAPKFLDNHLLETPSAALNVARMEIGQLGYQVMMMMTMAKVALEKQSEDLYREIEKADDLADILHHAILEYLNRIGKSPLTEVQAQDYFRLTQAADTLEGIGDILESDLSRLGLRMVRNGLQPSVTTQQIMEILHGQIFKALEAAVRAVVDNDQLAAQDVLSLRSAVNDAVDQAFQQQTRSLAQSELTRLQTLQLEFEMTDKLKQIYSLSKRIARLYVPREV
ncbi:MAG: Na/Pi cotransporter family protein [Desulfuromonadales bacterium]|nr:Na/Pi cotransporter family protein [Desulfuromonadales bacterium]MBN2791061.1 Na/Pi cotransporter family protein [Desulfuromonadales bacterium]